MSVAAICARSRWTSAGRCWRTRSAVLEDEIMGRDLIYPARRLPDHGLEAWTMVKERGWEGLVAKDPSAPYIGGTTQRWLKVKVRHEGQFIVGGVMRSGSNVTGLLVGQREQGRLLYRGTVEWGLVPPGGHTAGGQRGRAGAANLTLR
jgi:bifunctional non-homologous end joining protein LigD